MLGLEESLRAEGSRADFGELSRAVATGVFLASSRATRGGGRYAIA